MSYGGAFQKKYDLYTDAIYSRRNWHFIGVTPTVRFDWVHTKTVRLYSSIGIGLGYHFNRERFETSESNYIDNFYTPTLDLTPLGICVGRKVFGFAEIGLSTHGHAKAGIGLRINDKNRK